MAADATLAAQLAAAQAQLTTALQQQAELLAAQVRQQCEELRQEAGQQGSQQQGQLERVQAELEEWGSVVASHADELERLAAADGELSGRLSRAAAALTAQIEDLGAAHKDLSGRLQQQQEEVRKASAEWARQLALVQADVQVATGNDALEVSSKLQSLADADAALQQQLQQQAAKLEQHSVSAAVQHEQLHRALADTDSRLDQAEVGLRSSTAAQEAAAAAAAASQAALLQQLQHIGGAAKLQLTELRQELQSKVCVCWRTRITHTQASGLDTGSSACCCFHAD
jgi:hypothetical protein